MAATPPPQLSLPQSAQVFKMLGDEIRLRLCQATLEMSAFWRH